MKILWLSHFLPYPPKGGALQRSHYLLLQISRRYEVHLISLNQSKNFHAVEAAEEAAGFLRSICKRVEVFPIPSDAAKWRWAAMTAASYFRRLPFDVNWLMNKEMARFLETLSGKESFDLIHVDTLGLYPYAAPFSNTPIVLNHHNVESHMMQRRFEKEKNMFAKVYFRREFPKIHRYERAVCGRCALNLVVSDLDGARLKASAGDVRIFVIPNGVDVDYFRPRKAVEGLIFAGALDWYPNREAVRFFLEEIWPKLPAAKREGPITFLGKNPPRELVEAAKQSTISAPGFVDDVRPYLEDAAIYICPIRDGGGTRLKILDALAMAKPLVATGMAVEGLDLVEEEHYLRAETAGEFVLQIDRLDNDAELRQTISGAGRQYVSDRFSWNVIGEKLARAYQEAVSFCRGRPEQGENTIT